MTLLFGMLRLTFRELWARKITVGLFLVSTLVWVMLTFALNLDIVDGSLAGLRIFGQEESTAEVRNDETGEVIREALSLDQVVVTVEAFVAAASYWAALLLGLFATASLLPALLERGRADLLLAKPISRSAVLAGHVLGVLAAVLALAVYLFGMVWLVMSIKTGIWHVPFLLSILLVVAIFGVMYSVMTFVGVTTQSAPLALIVAYGLLFASLILAGREGIEPQINPPWRQVFVAFYHVLPNVAEITGHVTKLVTGDVVASWYPLVSSLVFGAVLYGGAFVAFNRRDF